MKVTDKLFKHTLIRVGPKDMRGIMRLLDDGHTGIAERHTVEKLIGYVKTLEKQLGLNVPDPDNAPIRENMIKINSRAGTFYVSNH